MKKKKKTTVDMCSDCPAICCHDLALMITKPKSKEEISELKWEIMYDTVNVCIRNHKWYTLIKGRCIYLDKNNLCSNYNNRPGRCRRHNPPDCERYGGWYDVMISSPEELDDYLKNRKK